MSTTTDGLVGAAVGLLGIAIVASVASKVLGKDWDNPKSSSKSNNKSSQWWN